MKRRNFIKTGFVAGSSLMIPGFIQGMNQMKSTSNRKLIVVQLAGGNDGLNTIIPYRSDDYYKLRPSIAIDADKLIKIHDELGFHAALKNMASLYDNGELSIINQVGYPNQNKSHFRASDIWLTASDANQYLQSGWLGRYLDAECNQPHAAIQYGTQKSFALKGKKGLGMALTDPKQLFHMSNEPFLQELTQLNASKTGNLDFLYKTLASTQQSAQYLYQNFKTYRSKANYPKHKFAQSLKTIASLIGAGVETGIYYTEVGGFDTHTNQINRHKILLKQLDESLWALRNDLKASNNWDNTIVLVFSEFGRRIKENGSKGTDHGKANNVWLMGGKLKKPGFANAVTNLQLQEDDDLLHQIDFRSIYADITHNWLETNKAIISKHPDINLI